jgi:hypothetical protein
VVQQQVVRFVDASCRRVFDRHDPILRLPGLDQSKDIVERPAGLGGHSLAEIVAARFF